MSIDNDSNNDNIPEQSTDVYSNSLPEAFDDIFFRVCTQCGLKISDTEEMSFQCPLDDPSDCAESVSHTFDMESTKELMFD